MIKISTPPSTLYPQLINIWEASVRATHDFLDEDNIAYFRKRIFEEYFHLVDLYIATDDYEKIYGFIGLTPKKIEMLFIDPDYRDMGIGKQLVKYAINQHQVTCVDVNEQNPQAVGFYQKLGFKIINREPFDAEGKPFPILEMEFS